ncbi:MAG: minichromosome maintenance protein MCM [Candidatus Diapherotrites archaeon]|nr:minichromosome maintenance protein MCM [Candidatus Diapherotrites archaeon]
MVERVMVESSEKESPFVEKFQQFFESVYKKEIQKLVAKYPDERSLNIDFNDLEEFDFKLAEDLIGQPDFLIEAASLAVRKLDVPSLDIEDFAPHIRVHNLPDDKSVMLRDIGSRHIGKMLYVEGVIKQVTDVLPKLKMASWKCNRCGNVYRVLQKDSGVVQPAFCECRHRDFSLVAEDSDFIDYQKIQIQESLEFLKGNAQPTSVDVYVADDLVNMVVPGDKIKIVGILRLYPAKENKVVFGRFIETVHLELTMQEFEDIEISKEEEQEIKELSKKPDVYEKLVASIAPSIYGHETVKEAIALQLFGGAKKILPNDQQIRGNIHLLLVGDPGVAKSQMLMATHNIAPKSIYVGGKTTSAVGLTATAVKDEFGEGGWTLKAGALVLANGGIAMCDELDKMDPDERVALHEAMEQGTISVAKAGIVTRFKTDTSILAAANPKFSRFDPYQPFIEQLNLPPTLISRFDLFFMIRDILDRTSDTKIAAHILKTHQAGAKLFQARRKGKELKKEEMKEIEDIVMPTIPKDLLKKYISFARQNVFPTLSKEAIQTISDFYVDLRERGKQEGSFSATHRQLEGLVRLSEASARVRLSDVVEKQDADRAIRLLKSSLRDVVTDPETGKIDIDIIATGQTHSQVELMRKVLGIIKEKNEQMDSVPLKEVMDEAAAMNIDSEKADDIIRKLERKGEIYRPKHGFVKPTETK